MTVHLHLAMSVLRFAFCWRDWHWLFYIVVCACAASSRGHRTCAVCANERLKSCRVTVRRCDRYTRKRVYSSTVVAVRCRIGG